MATDAAKAFFLKTDEAGVSLHSHLSEVLQSLLSSKDPNALANFESISLDIKAGKFKPTVGVTNVPPSIEDDGWKKRSNALFTADFDEEDTGLPNVVEELAMFEQAGVGLAREEAYRLFLAMAGLKKAHGLVSIRFFGKILGTKKDYYVVEGKYSSPPPPTPYEGADTAPEAPGAGLNECAYYVAAGVSEPFELLPDVLPEQVKAALLIKKLFTGLLDAPVACYPPFPGVEKHYLRAQIARIAQATLLVPADKFAVIEADEDAGTPASVGPLLEANPDYEPKTPADMADLASWCRWYGGLLKIGRLTNLPKPEAEEGEEEGPEPEEEVPPLGGVDGDAAVSTMLEENELPAWGVKLYAKQGGYAVAVAKSNRWPGAYAAVGKGYTVFTKNAEGEGAPKTFDKAANVYIGYGCESTGKVFTPVPPPAILGEAADAEEQEEVTLDAENALLKAIDDAKRIAENGEEEPEEE